MTPEVYFLVKPLLRFWRPWQYVTDDWDVLTDDKNKAKTFKDNALYNVQDYYLFSRKKYEEVRR